MMVLANVAAANPASAMEAVLAPSEVGVYAIAAKSVLVNVRVDEDTESTFKVRVEVSEKGQVVVERTISDLFTLFALPAIRLVEMDASNDRPEVFLSSWSGGAHCCNEIAVFTKGDDGWAELPFGSFDARTDPGQLVDADYDGISELIAVDDRFLYEFASYAGSAAPIRIIGIREGRKADVTREPQFEDRVTRSLDDMGAAPDVGEARNSWLASYAAHLLLLGEDDPLDFAIGTHDASVDWGMTRCTVEITQGSCPDGKSENIGFEAALTQFLTETGYLR
ncbi:MAG: hypothetical protein AAFO77_02225 [Pseudomonadota bacterium]